VSWDALWSGPAKAAQAMAGHWTTNEVFVSFFVAGATVAAIAQLALLGAFWLRRVKFANPAAMARFNFWGKLLELSVIGGFGVLSLWQGLTGEGNIYWSIVIAFAILSVVFSIFRKELMENELSDATEAIE
jgi:ABC-type spermidine/putrescine transport system permease subunit II